MPINVLNIRIIGPTSKALHACLPVYPAVNTSSTPDTFADYKGNDFKDMVLICEGLFFIAGEGFRVKHPMESLRIG